jgi:hypothetical protein
MLQSHNYLPLHHTQVRTLHARRTLSDKLWPMIR